uniref:RNA-dependent RNA polymerase n=1 Tax=Macrophomina phaseolina partitivirus 1 TaxID=2741649 RepID=A0A7S6BCD3_9VIRU|nr:RNA-dependent RNA polymerase [Macrophomina phaseolina partitivirus 1]
MATYLPATWDFDLRYMTEVKRLPDWRRGILRQTQNYDPFVDVALKSFDSELRTDIKGMTRSPGDDYDLANALLRYDKAPISLKFSDRRFMAAYSQAVSEVMSEFKLFNPVVPHWILDVDLVKSTSSGYPHFKRKGDIFDQIRQEGRFHLHHLKLYDLHRCPLLPCSPSTRGGLSEVDNPKTRLVWMYPAAMTACEAVFAQPLIDALYSEKRDLFLTGVDSKFRIQRFLSLLDGEEGHFGVGLDFKAFDTFRSTQLIYDAFAVLKQNIKFGYYYDKVTGLQQGRSGVAARAEKAFDNIVEYFIHTPIVLPNGRIVTKHHGVPSGSHFTNLIDSIVNRILLKTFGFYEKIPIRNLRTNGDDSAFTVTDTYVTDIIQKASVFFDNFYRMTVSVDKSVVASAPSQMHVSGTVWTHQRPTRSTREWFMLAAYSDTYIAEPIDSFQRLLGLGIAGAFGDARYCSFFDYFQRGYDCRHGPNLLNWKKLRWLEHAFNITDLPMVYKQGAKSTLRLRLLVA